MKRYITKIYQKLVPKIITKNILEPSLNLYLIKILTLKVLKQKSRNYLIRLEEML